MVEMSVGLEAAVTLHTAVVAVHHHLHTSHSTHHTAHITQHTSHITHHTYLYHSMAHIYVWLHCMRLPSNYNYEPTQARQSFKWRLQQVQCTHSHMTSSEHNGHRTAGAISTTSVGGLGQWEMIAEVPTARGREELAVTR